MSTGALLVHLRWGEHRYSFWRQQSLTDFLGHAISERDSYRNEQYFPAYERLRHYADNFEERLIGQDRYTRKIAAH